MIYLFLFIFMFTHWGNHGFGDSSRIPLSNGLILDNIDWNEVTYIEDIRTENNTQLETTRFLITDDLLIGNLQSHFYDYPNKFFALNLNTKELKEFKDEPQFDNYLQQAQLPKRKDFLSFEENYHAYWNGWRFWLLP